MADVAIFGDSYVDPVRYEHQHQYTSWVNKLSTKYKVHNEAVSGTGPEYSLRKFLEYTRDFILAGDSKDMSIIFVCSDPCRLDLSCYKHSREAVEIFDIAEGKRRHKSTVFAKQAIQWMMSSEWQVNQHVMVRSTLSQLAPHFKNILYWSILSWRPYDEILFTPDNMCFPKESLIDISIRDCGENLALKDLPVFIDHRINHLQETNHEIMFEQVTNWIDNDTPIDTSKFIYAGSLETK
tara:strand:+ start:221 stop:934 length:714 start_codon:yes stop_codon:yes gene_type:complete